MSRNSVFMSRNAVYMSRNSVFMSRKAYIDVVFMQWNLLTCSDIYPVHLLIQSYRRNVYNLVKRQSHVSTC